MTSDCGNKTPLQPSKPDKSYTESKAQRHNTLAFETSHRRVKTAGKGRLCPQSSEKIWESLLTLAAQCESLIHQKYHRHCSTLKSSSEGSWLRKRETERVDERKNTRLTEICETFNAVGWYHTFVILQERLYKNSIALSALQNAPRKTPFAVFPLGLCKNKRLQLCNPASWLRPFSKVLTGSLSQIVTPVDPNIFQLRKALEVNRSMHVVVEALWHANANVHPALFPLSEARA